MHIDSNGVLQCWGWGGEVIMGPGGVRGTLVSHAVGSAGLARSINILSLAVRDRQVWRMRFANQE